MSSLTVSAAAKHALAEQLRFSHEQFTPGTPIAADYYPSIARAGTVRRYFASYVFSCDTRQVNAYMVSLCKEHPDVVVDAGCGAGTSSNWIRYDLQPRTLVLVDRFRTAVKEAEDTVRFSFTLSKLPECAVECRVGRVENLQAIAGLPEADLLFMRSVLRYVRADKYPDVFTGAYALLRPGGELVFDLPLKSSVDWIPKDYMTSPLLAGVVAETLGIPEISCFGSDGIASRELEARVVSLLRRAGFSSVHESFYHEPLSADTGKRIAMAQLEQLLDLAERRHRSAAGEIESLKEPLKAGVDAALVRLFSSGPVSVGLTVFKAVKQKPLNTTLP